MIKIIKRLIKRNKCNHSFTRTSVKVGLVDYIDVCWWCDKKIIKVSEKRYKKRGTK